MNDLFSMSRFGFDGANSLPRTITKRPFRISEISFTVKVSKQIFTFQILLIKINENIEKNSSKPRGNFLSTS